MQDFLHHRDKAIFFIIAICLVAIIGCNQRALLSEESTVLPKSSTLTPVNDSSLSSATSTRTDQSIIEMTVMPIQPTLTPSSTPTSTTVTPHNQIAPFVYLVVMQELTAQIWQLTPNSTDLFMIYEFSRNSDTPVGNTLPSGEVDVLDLLRNRLKTCIV